MDTTVVQQVEYGLKNVIFQTLVTAEVSCGWSESFGIQWAEQLVSWSSKATLSRSSGCKVHENLFPPLNSINVKSRDNLTHIA